MNLGWFADYEGPDLGWAPNIQALTITLALPIWFDTEDECLEFIRKEVIGMGMYPGGTDIRAAAWEEGRNAGWLNDHGEEDNPYRSSGLSGGTE